MERSEYLKKRKEKRKSEGLCVGCGEPIDRDGIYCTKCREKINKYKREHRQWYLSHKICPRCGKNDLMGDETICPECRANNTNNLLSNRVRINYNESHKKWAKDTYWKRKEAGICTRCGKRMATTGMATCGICRAKENETRRIREGTSDREEHVQKGLCYFCDNPVKEGYKVCEKHYKMNIEKGEKGREAQRKKEKMRNPLEE